MSIMGTHVYGLLLSAEMNGRHGILTSMPSLHFGGRKYAEEKERDGERDIGGKKAI